MSARTRAKACVTWPQAMVTDAQRIVAINVVGNPEKLAYVAQVQPD